MVSPLPICSSLPLRNIAEPPSWNMPVSNETLVLVEGFANIIARVLKDKGVYSFPSFWNFFSLKVVFNISVISDMSKSEMEIRCLVFILETILRLGSILFVCHYQCGFESPCLSQTRIVKGNNL